MMIQQSRTPHQQWGCQRHLKVPEAMPFAAAAHMASENQNGEHAGSTFGDVMEDVANDTYEAGETVRAVFRSACPRNNVRLEGTFLTVERQNKSSPNGWDVVGFISGCFGILPAQDSSEKLPASEKLLRS